MKSKEIFNKLSNSQNNISKLDNHTPQIHHEADESCSYRGKEADQE
jgi:hypothetical protein